MQRRKSEATLQIPGQEQSPKNPDEKSGGNDNGSANSNDRTEAIAGQSGEVGLRTQVELISRLAMKGIGLCLFLSGCAFSGCNCNGGQLSYQFLLIRGSVKILATGKKKLYLSNTYFVIAKNIGYM